MSREQSWGRGRGRGRGNHGNRGRGRGRGDHGNTHQFRNFNMDGRGGAAAPHMHRSKDNFNNYYAPDMHRSQGNLNNFSVYSPSETDSEMCKLSQPPPEFSPCCDAPPPYVQYDTLNPSVRQNPPNPSNFFPRTQAPQQQSLPPAYNVNDHSPTGQSYSTFSQPQNQPMQINISLNMGKDDPANQQPLLGLLHQRPSDVPSVQQKGFSNNDYKQNSVPHNISHPQNYQSDYQRGFQKATQSHYKGPFESRETAPSNGQNNSETSRPTNSKNYKTSYQKPSSFGKNDCHKTNHLETVSNQRKHHRSNDKGFDSTCTRNDRKPNPCNKEGFPSSSKPKTFGPRYSDKKTLDRAVSQESLTSNNSFYGSTSSLNNSRRNISNKSGCPGTGGAPPRHDYKPNKDDKVGFCHKEKRIRNRNRNHRAKHAKSSFEKQDGQMAEKNGKEEQAQSVRVSLVMFCGFNSSDDVKAKVMESLSKTNKGNISLSFEEGSIISNDNHGICRFVLPNIAFHAAKGIVRLLANSLRNELKVKVTVDFRAFQENSHSGLGLSNVKSVPKDIKGAETDEQKSTNENRPQPTVSSKNDLGKSDNTNTPSPVPSEMSIRIGQCFSNVALCSQFLSHWIDGTIHKFTVIPSTIKFLQNSTECTIAVPSKAEGRRIKDKITHLMSQIEISCVTQSSNEKGENESKENEILKDHAKNSAGMNHLPKHSNAIDPAPVPAELSIVIGKNFSSIASCSQYLSLWIDDTLHKYTVISSSVQLLQNSTKCKIVLPSKAECKRMKEKLADLKLEPDVGISYETVPVAVATKNTVKEKSQALKDTEIKRNEVLDDHDKKIAHLEEKIKNGASSLKLKGNLGNEQEQKLALTDKLEEAKRQRKEFVRRFDDLYQTLKESKPDGDSKAKWRQIQQDVGVECNRLLQGLPIYARRHEIVDKVVSKTSRVSIIIGETGSGKSTQMVQYLYDAGFAKSGKIICTQPRKVAALALADRVAKEMAVKVGTTVGFKMGSKQKMTESTKILFTTDHALLNECLQDPNLSKYSCIIIDEAHERSIYTDLLLGMIKACLLKRDDLRVVVTSATIDPQVFIRYFGTEQELRVSGRTFPVDVFFDNSGEDDIEKYESRALAKAVDIHKNEEPGDVLVFLPTPLEIMRCCEEFKRKMENRTDYICLPLHGQLQPEEQKKVFDATPNGTRKIVFATNCAETSITISGIKYVVDTGVVKEARYDPKKNLSRLGIHIISKSSANQRKGRAGRTASGKCYRLFSEKMYEDMADMTVPEILRVHLGQAVLKLYELGVDIQEYEFVQAPDSEALTSALETLKGLKAIEGNKITPLGRWISKLPFDPKQGHMVYHAEQQRLLYDAVVLASLINNGTALFYRGMTETEEQSVARSKNIFASPFGDLFSWFDIYKQWLLQPKQERSKWCRDNCLNYKAFNYTRQTVEEIADILMKEFHLKMDKSFSTSDETQTVLRKNVFMAYAPSVCYYLGRHRAGYVSLMSKRQVHFHPSSILVSQKAHPEWVVPTEFSKTSREFIKGITIIEEDWIEEAVQLGYLHEDIALAKQKKLSLSHSLHVGKEVFRNFVGPNYANIQILEDELSTDGLVTIEADRQLGEIDVYSVSPLRHEALQRLDFCVSDVVGKLMSEECTVSLSKNGTRNISGTRVILQSGCCVKTLLQPDETTEISICRPSKHMTEEDIKIKFEKFGEIKFIKKFDRQEPWGFLKFGSVAEAFAAVEETGEHDDNAAVLRMPKQNFERKRFEAKLMWCRRPIKGNGTAFIKCPPTEKAFLLMQDINLFDKNDMRPKCLKLSISNKGEDLICFKTGNVTEQEVKEEILRLFPAAKRQAMDRNIFVSIAREHVSLPTQEEMDSNKEYLNKCFEKYISKENFSINFLNPTLKSINHIAFICFDNPLQGHQACECLNGGMSILGQNVNVLPNLKTAIGVPKRIMQVSKQKFDEIFSGLHKYHGMEVKVIERKLGDFSINVSSRDAKHLIEARELLQREIEGEIIDCTLNDVVGHLLKTPGQNFLKDVEKSFECLVISDMHREQIQIYGNSQHVHEAKIVINEYLNTIEGMKQTKISLNTPGLMKEAMKKYGQCMSNLEKEFQLSSIKVDWKKQFIIITGETEAVENAEKSLNAFSADFSSRVTETQKDQSLPDCVACFCPVDDVKSFYRLEACGHAYCKICLKMQVQVDVQSKNFPLSCSHGECNMPFVWKDVRFLMSNKLVSEEVLVNRSVSYMVATNKDKYNYCVTPNCPVVYKTTEIDMGNEFSCPSCFASICTSCHIAFHAGLTCSMAKGGATAESLNEEWCSLDRKTRKLCPRCKIPIEKTEGCNKMHCTSCQTYFCWLCCEMFVTEDVCYRHLQKTHGGFF